MVLYIDNKTYGTSHIGNILHAIKDLPSPFSNPERHFYGDNHAVIQKQTSFYIIKKSKRENFDNKITKKGVHCSKRTNYSKPYFVKKDSVVFVTDKKISTINPDEEVVLIVQDIETKKTALARISSTSTDQFIRNIFHYMPGGKKEVIMIGDKHGDARNVRKILRVLLKYEYDISINRSYVFYMANEPEEEPEIPYSSCVKNSEFDNDIIVNTSNFTVNFSCYKRDFSSKGRLACDLDRFLELSEK